MAEKTIELEPEVVKVLEYINKGENFLLSGGAGSGKTYSLVNVIKKVIEDNPYTSIACITYTNAAVKEIAERIDSPNLRVSTIHDFLWDTIRQFKKELEVTLHELINDPTSKIPNPNSDGSEFTCGKEIQYKEYLKIKEGIISHDEVLILSERMYEKYKVLCDILKDKYKFIFVDEYQDTSPLVINILLEHLKKSSRKNIIGFFGDSMQSIYDDSVGDLSNYVSVMEVRKTQNRRNPNLVINLANKLRDDGLKQEPSEDTKAPNMKDGKIKEGSIKFLYSTNEYNDSFKNSEYFNSWDFKDIKNTKELNLTHNLIASKAGFAELMDIYDKDPIIKLKSDIVKEIKDNYNIIITDDMTFNVVVDIVEAVSKKIKSKIKNIRDNPEHLLLYNKLKDKPFSLVKNIYLNKDSLIDDKKDDVETDDGRATKRDPIIKHLFKIQDVIYCYETKNYNEFIKKIDFKITSVAKKREINDIIQDIQNISENTIDEVINIVDSKGICIKDDKFNDFINNNEYLYWRIKNVKFKVFQNLYNYLEGFTPFSTQHKVKGTEFDNVFVILDNGKWNNYNFSMLFGENVTNENVLKRTQKIFYVCCTRAKENLVVYYNKPSDIVLNCAREWFGNENVINCDEILS